MNKTQAFLSGYNPIVDIKNQLTRSLKFSFNEAGAGLSRIYGFISNHTPFMVISAERMSNSRATNKDLSAQLIQAINSNSLGGIQLVGHYKYDNGTDADETSFFVPYLGKDLSKFTSLCKSLMSRFNQESIVFSDGKDIGYLSSGGFSKKWTAQSFSTTQIKDAWSSIRGKRFTFIESGFVDTIGGQKLWKELGLISDLTLPDVSTVSINSPMLIRKPRLVKLF